MSQAPPTRRRWYQFSLAAMFVVVTAVGLVGWVWSELKFVQARRAFPFTQGMAKSANDSVSIPFWRRWCGDEAVAMWQFPHDAPVDALARARQLFPEAEIHRLTPSEEARWMPQPQVPQPQPLAPLAPGPSSYGAPQ